jgi:hypothetical protein
MSRHGAFTALVLCGLLLVSACGSGKPAGHSAIRVGSVVYMGRYIQVFASPLPANPAQAGVVEGFREGWVLWDKSQDAQRLVRPVRDYVTGQALTHLAASLKNGQMHDLVPAGVDRFFMTRVTAITGRNAVVATCDDGSKFRQENPRTGKVDASFLASPGQEYLFETYRMVRLGGHWAITGLSFASLPSPSAEPCQPGMAGSALPRRPDVAVLLRETSTALRAASSVHISGTLQQGGKTLGLNLGITRSGEFSGQISENGAAVSVLATHGHTYLKLNAAFLRIAHLPATACSRFCGKYLEYSRAQSRQLFSGLSLASMTRSVSRTPARKVKYLGAVTVGGQPAWLLEDSHGNSVYVAAHGKPYPVREVVAPPAEGSVNLTQWNAVRIPGPPPASQVVHLSQLMG